MRPIVRIVLPALLIALLVTTGHAAGSPSVTEQRVSPTAAHFPQNKQNESAVAVNPVDPNNLIVAANDEIDEPDCTPASGGPSACPFAPGVGITGVYTTKNGGATWSRTVLDWTGSGLVSGGDPVVAFGPKPNGSGGFSYASGARAYAGGLASPAGGCLNCELVAVSRSNDSGVTWSAPSTAIGPTKPQHFNDRPALWADANPASPRFGTVYAAWTLFKGNPLGSFGKSATFSPAPLMVSHSTDGGLTWSKSVATTPDSNVATFGTVGGRGDASIRTTPNGDLYVFVDGTWHTKQSAVIGVRSTDGGATFSKPFLVSPMRAQVDPFPGASFRMSTPPAVDVDASTGTFYVAWAQYDASAGHGVVKLVTSADGHTWSLPRTIADVPGRSPFYAALAAGGGSVFVGFPAITDVPAGTPPGTGVVSYDAYEVTSTNGGATFGPPVRISAASSDPDASSTNALSAQFLGDYNGAAASSDGTFWFTWTDTRNGAPCAAVDAFRSGAAASPPNIYDSCPPGFGNSDIYLAHVG